MDQATVFQFSLQNNSLIALQLYFFLLTMVHVWNFFREIPPPPRLPPPRRSSANFLSQESGSERRLRLLSFYEPGCWWSKKIQILCCDWLSVRRRWRYLDRSRLPAVSRKKIVFFFHKINYNSWTNLVWPRWVDTGLVPSFLSCLLIPTPSGYINTHKQTSIQPSWSHAWSITHVYSLTEDYPPSRLSS